ncbi:MAG: hypothetical protein M0R33_04690 [Methylomonas sp.]|uniref:hypothetical protein n=1 Tax=Methylomonas sp. TaxID=418 RepID=UPI0025EC3243|nr:hypothetical protein [Methylomonas sp.]MCK9605732.1 hypothetical protein [Methylomonas sp.]
MPVFINEVIAEVNQPDSSEQMDSRVFAAANEQEEQLLRQLQIQRERQARLLVD